MCVFFEVLFFHYNSLISMFFVFYVLPAYVIIVIFGFLKNEPSTPANNVAVYNSSSRLIKF